jgi:hypothetical protein
MNPTCNIYDIIYDILVNNNHPIVFIEDEYIIQNENKKIFTMNNISIFDSIIQWNNDFRCMNMFMNTERIIVDVFNKVRLDNLLKTKGTTFMKINVDLSKYKFTSSSERCKNRCIGVSTRSKTSIFRKKK